MVNLSLRELNANNSSFRFIKLINLFLMGNTTHDKIKIYKRIYMGES